MTFHLTPDQRATIDSVSTQEAKEMWLQTFHQQHAWKHRKVVGEYRSLDPAQFTRNWQANEAQNMAEAWEEYHSTASESTVLAMGEAA